VSGDSKVVLDAATLAKIKSLATQFTAGIDAKATSEAEALADGQYAYIQRQKAETASLVEKNKDRIINRRLRTGYARSVLCYLICYSVFVGVLLLLSGFKICGFQLPESVLGFLVGSTAAAAIGLVFSVTNGLFKGLDS
jgi:hypothetical protein